MPDLLQEPDEVAHFRLDLTDQVEQAARDLADATGTTVQEARTSLMRALTRPVQGPLRTVGPGVYEKPTPWTQRHARLWASLNDRCRHAAEVRQMEAWRA